MRDMDAQEALRMAADLIERKPQIMAAIMRGVDHRIASHPDLAEMDDHLDDVRRILARP